MFTQTHYALAMGAQAGLVSLEQSDGHLRWHAKRSADVFRAFKAAFAAASRPRSDLVTVMAVQSGTGDLQLQQLRDVYNEPADAMAIASYFGYALNEALFPLGSGSLTIDQVLDYAREQVVKDTYSGVSRSGGIAAQFGIPLLAYDGGQHMGGGGSCGSGRCEDVEWLQTLFQAANRDPRMTGLYDLMLRYDGIALSGGGMQYAVLMYDCGLQHPLPSYTLTYPCIVTSCKAIDQPCYS
jgi:hypothetical protein